MSSSVAPTEASRRPIASSRYDASGALSPSCVRVSSCASTMRTAMTRCCGRSCKRRRAGGTGADARSALTLSRAPPSILHSHPAHPALKAGPLPLSVHICTAACRAPSVSQPSHLCGCHDIVKVAEQARLEDLHHLRARSQLGFLAVPRSPQQCSCRTVHPSLHLEPLYPDP